MAFQAKSKSETRFADKSPASWSFASQYASINHISIDMIVDLSSSQNRMFSCTYLANRMFRSCTRAIFMIYLLRWFFEFDKPTNKNDSRTEIVCQIADTFRRHIHWTARVQRYLKWIFAACHIIIRVDRLFDSNRELHLVTFNGGVYSNILSTDTKLARQVHARFIKHPYCLSDMSANPISRFHSCVATE